MPYTYDDLETLEGLLRQTAIDAWMCQGGQSIISLHPAKWQIAQNDNYYEINGHITNARDPYEYVSRPGPDGWGSGHHWVEDELTGNFAWDFNRRREEIDSLVRMWRDLPDPAKIAKVADRLADAYGRLVIADSTAQTGKEEIDRASGDSSLRPPLNVELSSMVDFLKGEADYIHGETASNFRTFYIGTTGAMIENFAMVALELYAHLVRQQAMWEGVRKDVASILSECIGRFRAVAKGRSDDWTQTLKILSTVNKGFGTAKDPRVKVLSIAAQYGLDEAADNQVKNGNLGTYEAVRAALGKTLAALNSEIRQQEDGIRRWTVWRLSTIWTDRGSYRLRGGTRDMPDNSIANSRGAAALHFDEIDEAHEFRVGSSPDIRWDVAVASGIAFGMDNIATHLRDTAKIYDDPDVAEGIRSYVTRKPGVGVGGGYGPSQAVQELDEALHDLLDNMAGDWEAGANNLRAATAYFQALEEGNTAQLAALQQAVDAAADDVMDGTGIKVHDYRNVEWWERMGGR